MIKSRLFIILVFIFLTYQIEASKTVKNDFGLRITTGTISGVNNEIKPQVSIISDFYCLSSDLRMIFGPTLIIATDNTMPPTVLHQIGLEYNIKTTLSTIIIGTRYFKSFIHDNEFEFNGGKNGWSFQLGTKIKLEKSKDWIVMTSWTNQIVSSNQSSYIIKNHHWQIQSGLEWYF